MTRRASRRASARQRRAPRRSRRPARPSTRQHRDVPAARRRSVSSATPTVEQSRVAGGRCQLVADDQRRVAGVACRSGRRGAAPRPTRGPRGSRRDGDAIVADMTPGAGADHAVNRPVGRVQRQRVARVDVDERLPRDVDAVRDVLRRVMPASLDLDVRTPERRPGEERDQRGAAGTPTARLGSAPARSPDHATSAATAQTTIAIDAVEARTSCSCCSPVTPPLSSRTHVRNASMNASNDRAARYDSRLLEVDRALGRLRRRQLLGPGREGPELHRRRRRGARDRRRVGLGQEHELDGDARPAAQERPRHRQRQARSAASSSARRRTTLRRVRGNEIAVDLPGADDGAEPGLHDRVPDHRDAAHRTTGHDAEQPRRSARSSCSTWSRCPTR